MTEHPPVPGPSHVPERAVRGPRGPLVASIGRPSLVDDGWWLALLWIHDGAHLASFRDMAPLGGPPPGPPLARLGPVLAGALGGFILEDGGRQQLRVGLLVPPDDPAHPWRCPVALRIALRWEPMRSAAITDQEQATIVLDAFSRAVEAIGRP